MNQEFIFLALHCAGPSMQDDLMPSMVAKCKESQPVIQRIIESIGDDESMLFEALNVHDELQQVLSKYEQLQHADPPQHGQSHDDLSTSGGRKSDASDERDSLGAEK